MEEIDGRSNAESMRTSTTTTTTSTRLPSPEGSKRAKSKKTLKRFPRVLKAILFETSLAKKIRKRRNEKKGGNNEEYLAVGNVKQPTSMGNESLSPSTTKFKNGDVEPNEVSLSSTTFPPNSTPSLTTMSMSSNSTFSSTNSSSTDKTTTLPPSLAADAVAGAAATTAPKIILLQQQQQQQHKVLDPNAAVVGKGGCSSNIGLCLVAVSLVVLVFWGKICAIMFTSTWLFFVPHCIPGTATLSGRIGAYYRRIDPEDFNKDHQVVATAEGFVERSRNRARRWVGGLKARS